MTTTTAIDQLRGFIGQRQLSALRYALRGEEREYFAQKLTALADLIGAMPKTYEQDGKGEQATAYLHYFTGSGDWYITEKDAGAPDDEPGTGQLQAFGLADLYRDGGEIGYIAIAELIANHVELDLYWSPKTLAECRK